MITTLDVLNAEILIVDDQEANVLVLECMLRAAGYTAFRSTRDGREVADLHRAHRFALILLDLKMPLMDGFAVMEQLKDVDDEGDLPVLVVTAEPGHRVRAMKAGARDFVTKPLNLSEVLVRARGVIEVQLLRRRVRALRDEVAELKTTRPA